MNTFKKAILLAVSIVFSIAAFFGFAVFGLVFLSILFVSSLGAIAFAAWENRTNIMTTYATV